jgi:indolepyruvate ferredoxin oxidoreductase
MGDTIFSNMILLGAAWQQGLVPLSHDAITRAVQLNGAAVERNLRAFEIGRWAILNQTDLEGMITSESSDKPLSTQEKIDFRAEHLRAYQGSGLARKYRALVDRAEDPVLRAAIAEGYHKVLSYKDEYEVARLHRSTAKQVAQTFEGRTRLTYHMAPPVISAKGSNGRPVKRALPGWIMRPALGVLSLGKVLRGTPLDPFGYQKDRRMERALIREYEADMELALSVGGPAAVELARLPLDIRGFGPVKEANQRRAAKTRESLLAQLRADQTALPVAAE